MDLRGLRNGLRALLHALREAHEQIVWPYGPIQQRREEMRLALFLSMLNW